MSKKAPRNLTQTVKQSKYRTPFSAGKALRKVMNKESVSMSRKNKQAVMDGIYTAVVGVVLVVAFLISQRSFAGF